jgi:uroporphyrinogen decarboxylase
MTTRERTLRCLRYESYDRLPILHFGYWRQTLRKWADQGHISNEDARTWADGNPTDRRLSTLLGFDSNWSSCYGPRHDLVPRFERKVLETLPNGDRKVRNDDGVVVLESDSAVSIPAEIDHLLVDRKSWETHYLPRLQFDERRIADTGVNVGTRVLPYHDGGLDYLRTPGDRSTMTGIFCGSALGRLRNWIGITGLAYISVDDPDLFDEMLRTVHELSYRLVARVLADGAVFDFAHYWEDICYKNGPLVSPDMFRAKTAAHYRRMSDLLRDHGVDLVSVDCDGCIDRLVPIWLENGVNVMFPIEVGTWNASIAPWRETCGRELRGVGGMNKVVFARDRAAIDAEIERLKPLVDLGGFIPCPDHRIPPDAEWDNVRYYCDRMRETFGGR